MLDSEHTSCSVCVAGAVFTWLPLQTWAAAAAHALVKSKVTGTHGHGGGQSQLLSELSSQGGWEQKPCLTCSFALGITGSVVPSLFCHLSFFRAVLWGDCRGQWLITATLVGDVVMCRIAGKLLCWESRREMQVTPEQQEAPC